MSGLLSRIALAALPLAAFASAPLAAETRVSGGEAELAELLEGRVAGEPVDCILDSAGSSLQIVDGTAMVFRRGPTIYVNRPEGAAVLDYWDLPVIEKWNGSKLCKRDRVELRDRSSPIGGPVLLFAQFVPYTRPAR